MNTVLKPIKSNIPLSNSCIIKGFKSGSHNLSHIITESLKTSVSGKSQDDLMSLLLSSIFMPQAEYFKTLFTFVSSRFDQDDPVTLLLSIIAQKFKHSNFPTLTTNWPQTFSFITLSLLNQNTIPIDRSEYLCYCYRLGSQLFLKAASTAEKYFGLFLIFLSETEPLFKFLDTHAKNTWRMDPGLNMFLTIENLLHQNNEEKYEITKVKLAFYRGWICYDSGYTHNTGEELAPYQLKVNPQTIFELGVECLNLVKSKSWYVPSINKQGVAR